MTTVRFIGDTHGHWKRYKKLIKAAPEGVSLQLGDFGVGFYEPYSEPPRLIGGSAPYDTMAAGSHYFIRGNHDNPAICAKHPFWVPDGTYAPNAPEVFCVGGASSIDQAYRVPGYTWWEDEELSYGEWLKVMDVWEAEKPDIVATHELPESACQIIMGMSGLRQYTYPETSRTRQALDNLLDIHRPSVLIHGHWHVSYRKVIKGTEFIGLGECAHLDLEI
jgi:predicted phosphodiesterase